MLLTFLFSMYASEVFVLVTDLSPLAISTEFALTDLAKKKKEKKKLTLHQKSSQIPFPRSNSVLIDDLLG